eukprot:8120853-Pyramimonas_sp.AAC.1
MALFAAGAGGGAEQRAARHGGAGILPEERPVAAWEEGDQSHRAAVGHALRKPGELEESVR